MKIAVWLGRRLIAIVLQLLIISFLTFSLLFLMPGSPEQILIGPNPATAEQLESIRERYGLNEPFLAQYADWLGAAVHLDFGTSIANGEEVSSLLIERSGVTVSLAIYAIVLLLLLAVPLGLVAGARAGGTADRVISAVTTMLVSAPAFATGLLLLYVFGVVLRWFPIFGFGSGFTDVVWHLTLPAATLAIAVIALIVRQTRAVAATIVRSDYVLFGRARGVAPWTIWTRYLLRGSSMPLVTSMGLVLGFFLTGTVVVERLFSIPGLGSLLINAVSTKDLPVVQGATILVSFFVLLANLLADASHLAVDPRVRKAVLA
ncbi:ABC transporter permease [Jiangella anatolica]|uniref:ABC transporter permease n=1 Tax=Jiangella anatolica TaxID=2670374 RepID=A0A2W2D2A2_9ACTN|nr:ABC transporter permease [Jiangella anatolica]PZF86643.1 ABC transporter permease [Jiangella anatolica]